jgi:DNA modification methylase
MVKNEESSLFFPSGDAAMLAFQIDRIFSDDELAVKLSQEAKIIALKRHDIVETTNQYMNIYAEIIKNHAVK